MPSRKDRKIQVREEMIFESAARLIDQVGYTRLTMDMLSEDVGIAKTTLYQHFKSKEDLVAGSTLRALGNLESFMKMATGTAIEQLQSIMRYMMNAGYAPDSFPSMVMHDEVLSLFASHEAIGAKFQQLNTALFQLVEQAKLDNSIAPDLPNEVVVTAMMYLVPISKARMIYPAQQLDALIKYVIRILFNGLKPENM